MIKGIDVKLGTETVHNVLIGEPTALDMTEFSENKGLVNYILAIPKGDQHSWIDKKIEFFGETFRTIGFPIQGIDELIPLKWNKKVKVERLVTNGNCTIFEKDTYQKHIFKDVHYSDQRGETVAKDGIKVKGDVKVHVYSVNNNDFSYTPQIGDIIVPCESDFVFDTTSQQATSTCMAEFRKLYPDYSVIKSCSLKVYGSMPDFDIIA